MRSAHYVTIAASVALIVVLYFGGNLVAPVRADKAIIESENSNSNSTKYLVFDSILKSSKLQLSKSEVDEISRIEKKLNTIHDSVQMAPVFLQLSKIWETHNEKKISAYYEGISAKFENSEKNLTFAARIFLQLMHQEDNSDIRLWEARQAVELAEQSFKIDSNFEETKLVLATGYVEGVGETMKGVQLLLGLVKNNPNNITANLLLGKMSVQSGQIDKAISRFETVLKQDSLNKDAYYYLAQAYKGKGNKQKAIELLETGKRIVNDKEFSEQADQEINLLK